MKVNPFSELNEEQINALNKVLLDASYIGVGAFMRTADGKIECIAPERLYIDLEDTKIPPRS